MPIELRILSGARAGERLTFDQPVVTVGRQHQSDLRFDAQRDVDVSGSHAELRESAGSWTIADRGSTNGTFLNRARVTAPSPLRDGDIVAFGAQGPTVEVRGVAGRASQGAVPRRPTEERVAIAVRSQTRGLRVAFGVAVVGLCCVAAAVIWASRRQSVSQMAALMRLVAQSDSATAMIRAQVGTFADTGFVNALQRQNDSLRARVQSSGTSASAAQVAELRSELERRQTTQQGIAGMDFSSIASHNDSAVAFLVSDIGGQRWGGTAFSVTPDGLLITNRHCVQDSAHTRASSITIQFANTTRRIPAHVVKVSDTPSLDLALVQLDDPGRYPTVRGVHRVDAIQAGAPVVAIGFPESLDLPMAGDTVKSTLVGGTVAKTIADLLQLDSFAAEGESGTPVFGTDGYVVGVVFGGLRESHGRIVYAVPSAKLADFLPPAARSIVR